MIKGVDIKKYISKKYWDMIDWDATLYLGAPHKDEEGYWIILKQEILNKYASHNIHEPLKNINWYLKQINNARLTNSEAFDW